MQYRRLGRTELRVSAIAFGAGPIAGLMTGSNETQQRAVVDHAIRRGINWFDTAATYGNGQSEASLGLALEQLDVRDHASLARLRLPCVALLQLHNSITPRRDDEPTSLTPADVLDPGGVADAFAQLQAEGLVAHLGLTGIGHPAALAQVVRSGRFDTMQVPYHLLNPSAGREMPDSFSETNYGNIIATCAAMDMGVLTIRALAGGALADAPPSEHTFKTPFFPLALYERDRRRALHLRASLPSTHSLPQLAIRFAASHRHVASAIVGFAETWQIDQAVAALELSDALLAAIDENAVSNAELVHPG
jgi:aryl-alcohol dehydrogenase-like predicted oxidoreductase